MQRTPLYERHIAAGGRMVPFAGYEMPVQYEGVLAEARAVRKWAGVFDVSHMGRLILTGDRVLEFVQWVTTNDADRLGDGTGQYSLLPNGAGGLVDDIIVYRKRPSEFLMVVNAANHAKDAVHLVAQNRFGVEFHDQTEATALLAVQGPSSVALLADLSNSPTAFHDSPMFGLIEHVTVAGIPVSAMRSGYTGEDGYELICAAEDAVGLWDALVSGGVTACGLGARDTLRVEAGLPLYGHELDEDRSPLEAGLGWVISKTKPFLGSEIVQAVRDRGARKKLVGVRLGAKRLIPSGALVLVDDEIVGEVSSGVVSPMLDTGIALAFVDPSIPLKTLCELEIRGKREPGTVVNKRFYRRIEATA